jgi:hypothetical protein
MCKWQDYIQILTCTATAPGPRQAGVPGHIYLAPRSWGMSDMNFQGVALVVACEVVGVRGGRIGLTCSPHTLGPIISTELNDEGVALVRLPAQWLGMTVANPSNSSLTRSGLRPPSIPLLILQSTPPLKPFELSAAPHDTSSLTLIPSARRRL